MTKTLQPNVAIKRLSTRILRYLEKYPEAGDTIEGITMWWLEYDRIDYSVSEVREALEYLIFKGKVKRVNSSRKILYKIQ